MKEKPIIFSAPMVRAILDGSKTQTRRIVKKPFLNDAGGLIYQRLHYKFSEPKSYREERVKFDEVCPYGVAGDRLYVKGTHWRYGKWVKNGKSKTGRQKWKFATNLLNVIFIPPDVKPKRTEEGWHKRPSIFMPRWASRITLEITGVRVERLQEISSEDVLAEGCPLVNDYGASRDGRGSERAYATLWDSLHGKGAWERNDWIWVLTFKRHLSGNETKSEGASFSPKS